MARIGREILSPLFDRVLGCNATIWMRASSRTAIAGGEHEFTQYGFKQLIANGCVDVVQLDVNRFGGFTEARKIVALAHNLPVVPHAPDIHNVHLVMASINIPLIEYFSDHGRDGDRFLGELVTGTPEVRDGYMYAEAKPGLGVSLNAKLVEA